MKTLGDTLVIDKIVTESGREFYPAHKDLLDKLPPDIVKEMAKRKLEKIKKDSDKK